MHDKLNEIAFKLSKPFCYQCYTHAIETKDGPGCPKCFSDDLMRITEDDGPEFGVDWIIPEILEANCHKLSESDLKESFDDMLDECYEPVKICGIEFCSSDAFKRLDPIAYDLAFSEYIDSELSNESLYSPDDGISFYSFHEIESFIDENLTPQTGTP